MTLGTVVLIGLVVLAGIYLVLRGEGSKGDRRSDPGDKPGGE